MIVTVEFVLIYERQVKQSEKPSWGEEFGLGLKGGKRHKIMHRKKRFHMKEIQTQIWKIMEMKCAYITLHREQFDRVEQRHGLSFITTFDKRVQMYKDEGEIRDSEFKAKNYFYI